MSTLPEGLASKLAGMADRIQEIDSLLSTPEVAGNSSQVRVLVRERAGLTGPMEKFQSWRQISESLTEARELVADDEADPELKELAQGELDELTEQEVALAQALQEMLLLEAPDQNRDVIVEIRAGTGGDEAALFASDLFRMYVIFAEEKGWKIEIIAESKTDLGGFKEIVFSMQGDSVYRVMQFESGGHRVQRIPVTETGGRIHTSAATVAVLPEVEDVEVDIRDEDIKLDTFCASGPGGQHVNKTASAVRITHLPTGIVVSCQDEKSQHRNKNRAMRVLRSRLYEIQKQEQAQAIAQERKSQIGSGDRSQRIRTYNFPQNRITDHRAGFSLYNLQEVLEGKFEDVAKPLLDWDREQKLKNL